MNARGTEDDPVPTLKEGHQQKKKKVKKKINLDGA